MCIYVWITGGLTRKLVLSGLDIRWSIHLSIDQAVTQPISSTCITEIALASLRPFSPHFEQFGLPLRSLDHNCIFRLIWSKLIKVQIEQFQTWFDAIESNSSFIKNSFFPNRWKQCLIIQAHVSIIDEDKFHQLHDLVE